MFDKLFSPVKIRDLQLPHRIILPAMGTKFSGNDSYVTDPYWLIPFSTSWTTARCAS